MNGLVATHTNDKTIEFPLKDHLGSPRVVLKQDIVNGNVTGLSAIDMYSWHPFGGILQTEGNGEPHYGFTGQEKDYESDLHNFRARQYSDNLGRFFAVDPQGQYHSPYVYGGNNPMMFTDPDGEWVWMIPILIGAGVNVHKMHASVVNGNDPFAVADAFNQAKEFIAKGSGPVLIDMQTYRFSGHSPSDASTYRTRDEIELWRAVDPVKKYRDAIIKQGLASEEFIKN